MVKKRLKFNEFNVPIPKGHKRIIDKDEITEYLFITAPNNIYTIYFHSGMPLYEKKILKAYNEGSTLEIKLIDRKIHFFCPSLSGNRRDGLWFFRHLNYNTYKLFLIHPFRVFFGYFRVF